MNELLRQLAHLVAEAIALERNEGRDQGLREAVQVCDHLANMGNWDQTVGAAECAGRIRQKLKNAREG